MRVTSLIGLLGLIGSASALVRRCDKTSCGNYNLQLCARDSTDQCIAPVALLKGASSTSPLCTGCNECPSEKVKCTDGYTGPPEFDPKTIPFACGKNPQADRSVTTSFDSEAKHLIITLNGPGLEKPKVGVSFTPMTSSTPGQLNANDYCTETGCVIPIEDIMKDEGVTDICGRKLYIAVHSGVTTPKDDTCWVMGTGFGKNWGTQYTVTFNCPEYEKTCCCCAKEEDDGGEEPPVVPPRKCNGETAYAKGATLTHHLWDSQCITKGPWGWYQQIPAADVNSAGPGDTIWTGRIMAGQTIDRGEVTITKTGDMTFSVSFNTGANYGVGKVHLDASCLDPKANLGDKCRTPGKYEFDSGCLPEGAGSPSYTSPAAGIKTDTVCSDYYYFLIHAETYDIVNFDEANPGPYNNCKAYDCGTFVET